MQGLDRLPATLQSAVRAYCDSRELDYTSKCAMYSKCERESLKLAVYLENSGATDEDGYRIRCRAWVADAPREGDEKAQGHVVTHVEWDMETWAIDLTCAQFGEPGPTCELLLG